MVRMLTACMVVGVLFGTPSPVSAQEISVGVSYAPNLLLHGNDSLVGCCMAIGPWLSIDRLDVEYVIAWDYHWERDARKGYGYASPDTVIGQLLTVQATLRSWRTPRFHTKAQVGVRYGTSTEPIPYTPGAGGGLTVDYVAGRAVMRGAVRFLWPQVPEVRLGIGFGF